MSLYDEIIYYIKASTSHHNAAYSNGILHGLQVRSQASPQEARSQMPTENSA